MYESQHPRVRHACQVCETIIRADHVLDDGDIADSDQLSAPSISILLRSVCAVEAGVADWARLPQAVAMQRGLKPCLRTESAICP